MTVSGTLSRATCPECGASVPVVRGRWLLVHNTGSPEYAYPRSDRPRCLGSFMPVSEGAAGHAPAGSETHR